MPQITPMSLINGCYQLGQEHPTPVISVTPVGIPEGISEAGDAEDDSRTVSTDDPVGAAMNATLDEDDDDDEQVLYPRMATESPKMLVFLIPLIVQF